jgi:hypothetical protein
MPRPLYVASPLATSLVVLAVPAALLLLDV